MPNRPYNPKQGGLQPYAIRPLPPEREAAVAAMTAIEVAREEARAGEPPIATHRPALFALCNRLIVLDKGRVVADGPIDEVIASSGGQGGPGQ